MDLLIAPGTVTEDKADTAPEAGIPGFATDGDPSTQTPRTVFPAYIFNAILKEFRAVILAAGLKMDRNDTTQLLQALKIISIGPNMQDWADNRYARVDASGNYIDARQISVVAAQNRNTALSTQITKLNGVILADGDLVFLYGQIDPRENGVYTWSSSTSLLSRTTNGVYDNGQEVFQPLLIRVGFADKYYPNRSFALLSPAVAIVGTDDTQWGLHGGGGVIEAGDFLAGPYNQYYPDDVAASRRIVAPDLPSYSVTPDASTFSQFPLLNLNNFGYISRYIDPGSPWDHTGAINSAFAEHNTVVFDRQVMLLKQITPVTTWSGKRFVFCAESDNGPALINMKSSFQSFIDLSNSTGTTFEGNCVIRYINENVGTNVVKAAGPVANFRADRICVWGNAPAAVYFLSPAVTGVDIDSIGGDSRRHLYINAEATSSGIYNRVRRIDGIPEISVLDTGSDTVWRSNYDSPIIQLNTAASSTRTVSISQENALHGSRGRFCYTATGGSGISIGGLKTLSGGDWCEIVYSSDTATWNLTGYGSL